MPKSLREMSDSQLKAIGIKLFGGVGTFDRAMDSLDSEMYEAAADFAKNDEDLGLQHLSAEDIHALAQGIRLSWYMKLDTANFAGNVREELDANDPTEDTVLEG